MCYRFVLALLLWPGTAFALEPAGVFLLVNQNVPESARLADHYLKGRDIPAGNVITLDLPTGEDISRADYDARMVRPIRAALADKKDKARVLLSMYGVPLRVGSAAPSEQEREQLKGVEAELTEARAEVERLRAAGEDVKPAETRLRALEDRKRWLSHAEGCASVDSELMLLWWDGLETRRWQANLLYFQVPEDARRGKPPVLMTCRLDGPTPEIVRRLIDDAIASEKTGLDGKVYVDARGIKFDPARDSDTGYGGYDESMRETAELFKKSKTLDVILDDRPEVFAPDSCPDCAIYCGWYSHANFVNSCRLVRGSVAWHLASSEAVSLRRADRNLWCKGLLENGACVTLGPVAEPYTIGFPKPAEFFGFLATGEYTLVECYARSVKVCSWMGVLIGDPLYKPFAARPLIDVSDVRPSPRR